VKKNPNALSAFGTHLRVMRERRGWSQQELADTAHLPKKTVQRVELAKYIVGLDVIVSLARALEVPVKELVDLPGLEQMDRD
jgi:transcriptional regulator with XRE-family HTH domain